MPVVTRNESRGRLILNYHDGTLAKIFNDGSYELTLPYRQTTFGKAASRDEAEQAVTAEREAWILSRWEAGTIAPRARFDCPLK